MASTRTGGRAVGPLGSILELVGHISISHATYVDDILNSKISNKKKQEELLTCHATLHRMPPEITSKTTLPHYHVTKSGERIS